MRELALLCKYNSRILTLSILSLVYSAIDIAMGSLPTPPPDLLRVAIVGAGPAGLGAAIALSKLPNVQVDIYEKATELREVGAGIRIGYNCWKVLDLLGAAEKVRGHHKVNVYHR